MQFISLLLSTKPIMEKELIIKVGNGYETT